MPNEGQKTADPLTVTLDREAQAHALDVIDDIVATQRNGEDNFAPRPQPKGEDDVTTRQKPQPFVNAKRNEIISRFKTQRSQRPTEQPDDIDMLARSGMPPEFEQFREPGDITAEDAAAERSTAIANGQDDDPEPDPPAPPRKVKLRVNHQDVELDFDDVISHAQQSLAADGILNKAKSKLNEIDQLYEQTRNRVARPDPSGHQTGQDRSQQVDGAPSDQPDGSQSHTSDDDGLTQLVETMQFGDQKDAVPMLRDTIARIADQVSDRKVTFKLQQDRMNDEAARTGAVLGEFNAKHPELLKDRSAQAVMKEHVFATQVEDLAAIGVTPELLAQSIGHAPTPGDIAQAHQFYRSEGYKLRKPEKMLEDAYGHMLEFRGGKGGKKDVPTPPVGDANGRPAPRIAVNVDREQRRQNIAPAPNRTAPPQQQQRQVQPQRQDAVKSAFMRMKQQRDQARGRVVGA